MVLGLTVFATVCGAVAHPPRTLGDLAWSQLRQPHLGQTPVRHVGSGQVLRHVSHRLSAPPVRLA